MRLGYESVTMEMVADAARVTKAAVYYHFPDKASLLTEAMVQAFLVARQEVRAVLREERPLRDRLTDLANTVLMLPDPFASFENMMLEAASDLTVEQYARIRRSEDAVGQELALALEPEGIQDAQFRAHAFIAMLQLGHTRGPDGDLRFPDRNALAHALVRLFLDGTRKA